MVFRDEDAASAALVAIRGVAARLVLQAFWGQTRRTGGQNKASNRCGCGATPSHQLVGSIPTSTGSERYMSGKSSSRAAILGRSWTTI